MMAQRMFNLTKWQLLREGDGMEFLNPRPRNVVLDVNTPAKVVFYVTQPYANIVADPEYQEDKAAGRWEYKDDAFLPGTRNGEDGDDFTSFIGLVEGRDTLEFAVNGPFTLSCEEGPAYVYTYDGLRTETHVLAPHIFTRIANRRQRNPNLEMMEYQMKRNQQAFMLGLEREMERRLEAMKQELETYAPQRDQRAPAVLVGRQAEQQGSVSAEPEKPTPPADAPDKGDSGGSGDKRSRSRKAEPVGGSGDGS